ncbi:MAG: cytosine permease [Lachnospiraceae bacterium]|nr:cytosine permease [Lachnospiraceae bacterium]
MAGKTHEDHDYSITPVGAEGKKGFASMLVIMLGFTFYTGTMLTGGQLGTGLTFKTLLLVLLAGDLILGTYTAVLAYISAKTALSTHLLARYSFGLNGSYFASAILGLTQVGWFGVSVVMLAKPVAATFHLPIWPVIIALGAMMTASAYFGVKSLAILSFIAVPSIAILGCYSSMISVDFAGGFEALTQMTSTDSIAFTTALALVVGSFVSGGTLTPDFTRFSKTPKIAVVSTVAAFFIGNIMMFAFGAIGGLAYGLPDISDVMIRQGLVITGMVVLGLNIWTTNDNTIYAASLAFSNITKIEKKKLVIVNGIVATAFSMVLYSRFTTFLSFLSGFIPSLGAIIIADYFFVQKNEYKKEFSKRKFRLVNYSAFFAFLCGVVCSYLPGISSLNAIAGSMFAYVLMSSLEKNGQEAMDHVFVAQEHIAKEGIAYYTDRKTREA